jgi:flagellar protein FlaG
MSLDVSHIQGISHIQNVNLSPGSPLSARPEKPPAQDTMRTKPPISIEAILGDLVEVSAAFNKRLSFRVNEKLGQVVVKVIDVNTDKVIREIPPEELQHVHERIREVIGLLFDERA